MRRVESKGRGKGMELEGAKAALENLGPGTVVASCMMQVRCGCADVQLSRGWR